MTALKYLLLIAILLLPGTELQARAAGATADNDTGNNGNPGAGKAGEHFVIKKNEVVVVTATLTPKALKDLPTSMNVVEQRDIRLSSSKNALDILNGCPGIFVNRSGDFGRADIDIRGLGQNCRRVAVLVDGKPEKMGLFGCAVSHAFPLDNVERIEVVKGPASMLYGGEALGGAVNIVTRLPKNKFETDVTASLGSFNTRQFNLKHGGSLAGFKYFFSFDKRDSDGHVENAGYSGHALTGKVVYDINRAARFSLQAKYFDGKKYEPGTIDAPLTDFWNDYKRGSVDLSFNREWTRSHLEVKLYRNAGKHRFSDGWDSGDYTDGISARFTTRALTNNEITVGGDLRFFGGESFNFPVGKWDKTEGSLFIRDELILNTRWILSSGLRLHVDSLYGSEWCPRFGAVFHPGQHTTLRAVISKGFRSPQLNELYMFPSANPDLEPERVWNYEIGVEHRFGSRVTAKAGFFHMKGSSMILLVPNAAPPPRFRFANSGEFSFYGAELELDAVLSRRLTAHMSYAFMDPGDHTKGRPGQKADFSLLYAIKKYSIILRGQYVNDYFADDFSRAKIPAYWVLDSRVIIPLGKTLELVLDVNNILNEDYCIYGEFPGLTNGLYKMPGRNFQVGIKYSHRVK